ncbi:MAG: hypothetical protein AAFQ17_01510, partial [Pseudomonadota bacterium]
MSDITEAQIAAAKERVPLAFEAPLEVRRRRTLIRTGFVLLFVWCLIDFEFIRIVLFSNEGAFEPWQTFYRLDRREDVWIFEPMLPFARIGEG